MTGDMTLNYKRSKIIPNYTEMQLDPINGYLALCFRVYTHLCSGTGRGLHLGFLCVCRLSPLCYHGAPLKCGIGTDRDRILGLEFNPAHQLLIFRSPNSSAL